MSAVGADHNGAEDQREVADHDSAGIDRPRSGREVLRRGSSPTALEAPQPRRKVGGAAARLTTPSSGRSPACPRKCARSCSSRSSASQRCSSSSALLGLRVLGQANARVERLGTLQVRVGGYQGARGARRDLRQLLGVRVGGDPGLDDRDRRDGSSTEGSRWSSSTATIRVRARPSSARRRARRRYGFVPPRADERAAPTDPARLRTIVDGAVTKITGSTAPGITAATGAPYRTRRSPPTTTSMLARRTALDTSNETNALIAQNRSAYRTRATSSSASRREPSSSHCCSGSSSRGR